MSKPERICPLLNGITLGKPYSSQNGVVCYPARHNDSGQTYIVKTISIPESRVQVEALLLSGAVPDQQAARSYFKAVADGLCKEADVLDRLSQHKYFLSYAGYQLVTSQEDPGYCLYLLAEVGTSLTQWMLHNPMTHLNAVRLGIDLSAAMALAREMGYVYADLKPGNIFLTGDGNFCIGDLGFISLSSLSYSTLPARYCSQWLPPEALDPYATLNPTVDTYSLGMLLYQIYNGGQLPPLEAKLNPKGLPAPAYADFRLGKLILRACAPDPKDRFQDPMEMGRALITYMQRSRVSDKPIVPAQKQPVGAAVSGSGEKSLAQAAQDISTEESASLDFSTQPETVEISMEAQAEQALFQEADLAGEPGEEQLEAEAPVEPEEHVFAVESVSETEVPQDQDSPAGKDELEADELPQHAQEENEEISEEKEAISAEAVEYDEFKVEPVPDLTGDTRVLEPISQDQIPAQAEIPDQPEEPAQTQEEIAAMMARVDQLIAEITSERAAEQMQTEPAQAEAGELAGEDSQVAPSEEDDTPELLNAEETPQEATKKKRKGKFRWFSVLIALVFIIALGAGGYFFYTNVYCQTIDDLILQGEGDSLTVLLTTKTDNTLLNLVCRSADGAVQMSNVVDGRANFTDLLPGTEYTVTVLIRGEHKLLGKCTATYNTPGVAQVTSFTALTDQEDGSALVSLTAEGDAPTQWILSYQAPDEQAQQVTFQGDSTTISGLEPGKTYTLRLSCDGAASVTGTTELSFTASKVINAQALTIADFSAGELTATWNLPEDSGEILWHVACVGADGSEVTLTTRDGSAKFQGLDPQGTYQVEVTADGMAHGTIAEMDKDAVSVSGLQAASSETGDLTISWESDEAVPEDGWRLCYTLDGSEEKELPCEGTSAILSPGVPGGNYIFRVSTAQGQRVYNGKCAYEAPKAERFDNYGVTADNFSAQMFHTPALPDWGPYDVLADDATTSYAPGDYASFLLHLNTPYNIDYTEVVALTVIRDESGRAVVTGTTVRGWSNIWSYGFGELDLPQLPEQPGNYTVTVYFDGAFVLEQAITIS